VETIREIINALSFASPLRRELIRFRSLSAVKVAVLLSVFINLLVVDTISHSASYGSDADVGGCFRQIMEKILVRS
jgi:hypothetical protein